MFFCGFCEEPCDDTYEIQSQPIQAYGQRGELSKSMFFCDVACENACIRNKFERSMMGFLKFEKDVFSKKGKIKNKEEATYFLTIRSLAKYLKACFERKPKEELKILREHTKRMFGEAFCYQTLGDALSRWNAALLNDALLDAFSK